MPATHRHPTPAHRARSWPVLAALTVAVLWGHWTLLFGAPLLAARYNPAPVASDAVDPSKSHAFTTRSLNSAPLPVPASAPVFREKRPVAPVNTPQTATEIVATSEPTENPVAPILLLADASSAPPALATAAATAPVSDTAEARYAIPAPARIAYEVKGMGGSTSYTGSGELLWQHDGKTYTARLAISKFFIPLRVQTSKGQLTAQGLEPTRFGDRKGSEVAAHFERHLNKIVFSANTPDEPLQPGGQDQLSVFLQLAALLGGDAKRYVPGSTLSFQAVGGRYSEQWVFVVGALEKRSLPGGEVMAIKLTRDAISEHDSKVEIWLSPDAAYLPVHIRLSQKNGDFADMLWSNTQKP